MSGKELMIGDWVCYKNDNKYHQISSVNMQRDGSVLIAPYSCSGMVIR